MVALGEYNFDVLSDVEFIDLLSSETTCGKPSDFPMKTNLAVGGLEFHEKPLICAGTNKQDCYLYQDGAWKFLYSLKEARRGYAMTKSPFQDVTKRFMITGGSQSYTSTLNSSEVLTDDGWQMSVSLPVTISDHCMVTLNDTTVLVIGGYQNGKIAGSSFFFNSETNDWSEGPTMKTARSSPACGSIAKNSSTEEKSVIAVGGFGPTTIFNVVDILDQGSDTWRGGPDFPSVICVASMVEDLSGGVVVIGGLAGVKYLDTLYKLSDAGPDATWEEMSQKLKSPRGAFTAFLVPDEIAQCN